LKSILQTKKSLWQGMFIITVLLMVLSFSSVMAGVRESEIKVPSPGEVQILKLTDGSQLVGEVIQVQEGIVEFKTKMGTMEIAVNQIEEIQVINSSQIKGGKYWFPNPNLTRLYFGPTGRTLKAGSGYFTDLLLFFPGGAYGITDNITIGGGISIFPGVDFGNQIYYFTPKVGFKPKENLDVAISAMIIQLPNTDDELEDVDLFDAPSTVGVIYGVGTYGDDDKSLTFGLGFGYADDEISDKPAVLFGGDYRLSRRLSFVSENWIFPGVDELLVSYGIRFFGEKLSADLGLFNVLNEDAFFPGFPVLSFTWNF